MSRGSTWGGAESGKAWLEVSSLADKVVEWYPETEGAGEEGELPMALARLLRPAALAEYDKAINAVFLAGAEVPSPGYYVFVTAPWICRD